MSLTRVICRWRLPSVTLCTASVTLAIGDTATASVTGHCDQPTTPVRWHVSVTFLSCCTIHATQCCSCINSLLFLLRVKSSSIEYQLYKNKNAQFYATYIQYQMDNVILFIYNVEYTMIYDTRSIWVEWTTQFYTSYKYILYNVEYAILAWKQRYTAIRLKWWSWSANSKTRVNSWTARVASPTMHRHRNRSR